MTPVVIQGHGSRSHQSSRSSPRKEGEEGEDLSPVGHLPYPVLCRDPRSERERDIAGKQASGSDGKRIQKTNPPEHGCAGGIFLHLLRWRRS